MQTWSGKKETAWGTALQPRSVSVALAGDTSIEPLAASKTAAPINECKRTCIGMARLRLYDNFLLSSRSALPTKILRRAPPPLFRPLIVCTLRGVGARRLGVAENHRGRP